MPQKRRRNVVGEIPKEKALLRPVPLADFGNVGFQNILPPYLKILAAGQQPLQALGQNGINFHRHNLARPFGQQPGHGSLPRPDFNHQILRPNRQRRNDFPLMGDAGEKVLTQLRTLTLQRNLPQRTGKWPNLFVCPTILYRFGPNQKKFSSLR